MKKNILRALLVLLVVVMIPVVHGEYVKAEYKKAADSELPLSTMKVYKDMDTSFLKTFSYGCTYDGEVSVYMHTAAQMIEAEDVRLKKDRIVRTEGFYEEGDGGAGTYLLSSDKGTGCIELANGLYACLIPDTKVIDGKKWGVVSTRQLGAKGDGQTGEHDKINDAVNLAADFANQNEDVFRSIVYLPAGEYKCTNQVQLNVSNVNFVGEGNKSVIFTDNDYRKGIGYYEFFFTIWGAKDLYMADFLVEAREVNGWNYMRQMVFVDCDNVYTYRVNLDIPQEAFSKDYYMDKQYSSLTYYSGNKNMTLDNCKLELMCSTYRGVNLGILDFYSRGEENITIMNCELHSDARDEQVGIFSSRLNKDASFIRNIYFVNNTMYSYQPLDKKAAGGWRTMCFTVAYDDSKNISDVHIKGNHFIADLDSKLMTFGNGIESCVVEDNMMDIRCTDNLGAYLFDSSVSDAGRVLIQNNEIYLTYRDKRGIGKAAILGGKATVKNNTIVSDTWLGNMGYLNGIYEGNTYINLGYLGSVANDLKEVNGNKIISYGVLGSVMYFNGKSADQVVNFNGNYIADYRRTYKYTDVWDHVAKVQGNVKEINFTDNTYLVPNRFQWIWTLENPKVPSFIKGLFFRGATVEKSVCKNNILQGAAAYNSYGCTINEITDESEAKSEDGVVNIIASGNESKDYTLNPDDTICTSIDITKDNVPQSDIFTDKSSVSLGTIVKAGHFNDDGECIDEAVTTDKEIVWYSSLEGVATVDKGVVKRKNYGQVTVYAVPTDGSQGEGSYALFGKCNIHFVKGFATGIELQKDNITLQTTKKYKAMYEVAPLDKASQKVSWTSTNTDVVTVSSIGVIEAVGVGEAEVICSTVDGTNISKKIHVKVEPLTVKRISLNQSAWYDYKYEQENNWANKGVDVGDTIQLTVSSYTPDDATNKGIKKWVTTNENVATVDENGLVTAVGSGYCEIRAYSMDEACYGGCSVWVQPDKINKDDISVFHTDSYIRLEWKKHENIHGYIVYCDKGDGKGYQQMSKISDANNTMYKAYGTNVGWYVEPGKTYKYKIATYIERWDSNSYSHVYETLSDEITVTTYSTAVISSFNTNGVDTIGISVGGAARLGVYCSRKTMPSSFRSDNEEIFTVEDKAPGGDNYDLEIRGVKEGFANLILKGEDALGYEKKIPVYVYNFQRIGSNIQVEPLVKSVSVRWKVEDKSRQDGFRIVYRLRASKKEILLSMDELSITTDDNGEMYASYTIGGLESDKDYVVSVAPYKAVDELTFAGDTSKEITVHTPAYVSVNSIKADSVIVLKKGAGEKITAIVGPEDVSEPELLWIPYHESVVQVTETGKVDKTTGYAMIKGVNAGITKLSIAANDEENYQINVKAVVVPDKVTNTAGSTTTSSVSLSWNTQEGATAYVVYRYDEAQKKWVNIANVTGNSYVDKNLSSDTAYQYKITAYVTDGEEIYEGDATEAVSFTTQKTSGGSEIHPDDTFNTKKIAVFKISKNYTTAVKLSWKKNTEAHGYEIYQYQSKKWKKAATITKGSAQSATIKKLKAGTSYRFRIRAYRNNNGKKLYTRYTTLSVMTRPAKVVVTKVTSGKKKIAVTWRKVKSSGYEIQCCTSKKFQKGVKKVTVNSSRKTVTVKNLRSKKVYYVRMRAYSKVNGKKYAGAWSKVRKVCIK